MTSSLYPSAFQYPAMLISKAPSEDKLVKELESQKYFGQVKKDGYWYELEKTKDGEVYLFSRSKSKKTGELTEKISHVPHIKEWTEELPNGTILIGELYYPGKKSNDVTKIMGSLAEKAINRQKNEYGFIHYYIHDIIMYDNVSFLEEPFEKRYSNLYENINLKMPSADWLEIANVFENYCGDITMPHFHLLSSDFAQGKLVMGVWFCTIRTALSPVLCLRVISQTDNLLPEIEAGNLLKPSLYRNGYSVKGFIFKLKCWYEAITAMASSSRTVFPF